MRVPVVASDLRINFYFKCKGYKNVYLMNVNKGIWLITREERPHFCYLS